MKILPRALATGRSDRHSDVIALDYDQRRKRRVVLTARGGLRFTVDLPHAPDLKTGDAYQLEDGRSVLIESAPEQLMELTCTDMHHLARIAWHLGNRHLPAQIGERSVRIRADHVIADIARGLGAEVHTLEAPFEPERGAYHEH